MSFENNSQEYVSKIAKAVQELKLQEARGIIFNILVGTKNREIERYEEVVKITEELVLEKTKS